MVILILDDTAFFAVPQHETFAITAAGPLRRLWADSEMKRINLEFSASG
jgi:hypothetical protein